MRDLKIPNNAKPKATAPAACLEIFLFYPKLQCPKKANDLDRFFDKLTDLDDGLTDAIVFFNAAAALQYSRFMGIQHVVFRAYVEQAAIEGHSNGLGLKVGFLTKHHVHGVFPDWSKGEQYLENPYFDQKYAIAG